MCAKCDEIDKAISRYRRIQQRILDQRTIDGVEELIVKLDGDKKALHPDLEGQSGD